MMNKIGSTWSKWDLHIHSDASDGQLNCQEIVDEAVKAGLSCIALTDHHTVKNIDDIRELAKAKGLYAIAGVEFRTEYGKKSVHMIGLFPETYKGISLNSKNLYDLVLAPLDLTRARIVNEGRNGCNSTDEDELFKNGIFNVQVDFKKAADKIHEYGGIVTVHAGNKDNSLDREMDHEPRHNTTIEESLGPVKEELFKEGYIDFCDIYNSKKELGNADFYWKTFQRVTIATSDAHKRGEVGRSFTWIKAELSFEGLRHVVFERDRVSFEKPDLLTRMEQSPSKFLSKVDITKTANATMSEVWYNNISINLNPGLVAIIGNKGSGKSAITDIIGLCANSKTGFWSFLTPQKFRSPKPYDRSRQTQARIIWKDGTILGWKTLNENVSDVEVERVRYIPQNFLEQLCTTEDDQEFETEIKKIIFQHIPEYSRYGKNSLEEIIAYLSQEILTIESSYKIKIHEANTLITLLEHKSDPRYLKSLEGEKAEKEKELENIKKAEPQKVIQPTGSETEETKKAKDEISKIDENIKKLADARDALIKERANITIYVEELSQAITGLNEVKRVVAESEIKYQPILEKHGIDMSHVLTYSIDVAALQSKKDSYNLRLTQILNQLEGENCIAFQIESLQTKKNEIENHLGEPERQYQQYLKDLEQWKQKCQSIQGTKEQEGTLEYLKSQINYLNTLLPGELQTALLERHKLVVGMLENRKKILDIYKNLYEPVTSFISEYHERLKDYPIEINASFINRDFTNRFFDMVSQAAAGSFYGREAGMASVNALITDMKYTTSEEISQFAEEICHMLKEDIRDSKKTPRKVDDQLKSGHDKVELYDFIYQMEYIKPFFQLTMSGKPLPALSPGERGALLLLFYLFVDQDDKPLIIDQPEENLDNESVYNYLVQFIRTAKTKRQIIMVTHNPNLAVVCDADQVIRMDIDKMNKNGVSFDAGAIEDPQMNRHIVDVLEGTFPAFTNRGAKYNIIQR